MRMNMLKYIFVFTMITIAITPIFATFANNLDYGPPKVRVFRPHDPYIVSQKTEVIAYAADDMSPALMTQIAIVAVKDPNPQPSSQDPTPEPAIWFKMYQFSSVYYKFIWNTLAYSNGQYLIYVKAIDAAGNIGYATPITVLVQN